ncbi:right-handed parallel beta-helix repeat-containing protein [Paenibacillus tyrfis]|uniref:right-handed parallel beta-helix repeat-containing protein n=1 Tax=Paenibacillus tyrfis TaxID=1501230 RepID=UPI00209FE0EE|nr:right-handed parallel beta-helix repeat-containing protein [Paenibacillus tyrfis]MCP1312055.1 right-handed parallel beta-helix repeat-containing protein [Paenibacillus tyrfis]
MNNDNKQISRRKLLASLGTLGVGAAGASLLSGVDKVYGSSVANAVYGSAALNVPSTNFVSVTDAPFQADPTGQNDSSKAINDAFAYAGQTRKAVFFPGGTYLIKEPINVPLHVSFYGVGQASEIKAIAPISMFKFASQGTSEYGNRYGEMSGLYINGNQIATIGLELAFVVVERLFQAVQIENVLGPAVRMDSSQNNTFVSVNIERCTQGIVLLNGAGNNAFYRCEINDPRDVGILFDSNESLTGYGKNDFNNQSTGNEFDKCIIERGTTANYGVHIKTGYRNVFWNCDIIAGRLAKVKIEFGKYQSLNGFYRCTFTCSDNEVAISAGGYRTMIQDSIIDGYKEANPTCIEVFNETHIIHCHLSAKTYKIVNKAGDQKYNIRFKPLNAMGSTEERPNHGHMGVGVQYFNIATGMLEIWNGEAWKSVAYK